MVKFDSFQLPPEVLSALVEMGFDEATPIQEAVIPLLLGGRDAVAQAQTGTGKTAAFGIPLVMAALQDKLAIVIVPTRELAQQVTAELGRIGKNAGVRALAIYGGAPFNPQAKAIARGEASLLVATPGRLRDHLERGTLDARAADIIVLDEADEMLKMGFVDEIEAILDAVGPDRQTLLFSATMPEQIARLASKYLNNAERVNVRGKNDVSSDKTEQFVMYCDVRNKADGLVRLLAAERPDGMIVFRHTRDGVDELTKQLTSKGIAAEALHGGMAQGQREEVLARVRKGRTKVLVATNVAARGLDVDTLTHVVNFDTPHEADAYVHRIGRTGRAGREGRSFLFVAPFERSRLRFLERVVGTRLTEYDIPNDDAVADAVALQARAWLRSVPLDATPRESQLIAELVEEGANPVALAAKLLGRALQAEGITMPALEPLHQGNRAAPMQRHMRGQARAPAADGPRVAVVLAVGRDDNVRPADIVGALTNEGGLSGNDIGRIDILPRMSVAEVPAASVNSLLAAMQRCTIRRRAADIRVAERWEFRSPPRGMAPVRR